MLLISATPVTYTALSHLARFHHANRQQVMKLLFM